MQGKIIGNISNVYKIKQKAKNIMRMQEEN